MKRKFILPLLAVIGVLCCTSCQDFLDEMPDNRAELDTEDKVISLLVSAYPKNDYVLCAELSSDNADDYGESNPNGGRFYEQLFNWIDVTESDNESPSRVWEGCYAAIAAANQALDAIEKLGSSSALDAAKGEALVCRAYGHFILVNMFAQHYTKQYAVSDLGITYMEKPETELNPKYERGTVAQTYEKIEADLLAGLPLISDAIYSVPKYHFNVKAANAFAARFFLYYQKWDQAVKYANATLGTSPQTLLRDNVALAALPKDPLAKVSTQYISASHKCNFLILTAYSQLGTVFGGYYTCSRYAHGGKISKTETLQAEGPWGAGSAFYLAPWVYTGTNLDKVLLPRIPYLFEYTDAVAQTGYTRAVYVDFTAEETLLTRAEAYIMLKDYANATADMKLWADNTVKTGAKLTEANIEAWAGKFDYYMPKEPTPIKKLNPDFAIEAGKQESFLQCVLYLRRLETIHGGLRWFDVKRYGIELTRRIIQSGQIASTGDVLQPRDNRCALQIPADVVAAGLTPNPR